MTTLRALLVGCAALVIAAAAPPALFPVHGVIRDVNGTPVTGMKNLTFKLYDRDNGGTVLYAESLNVDVTQGAFAVHLGQLTPLPLALFRDNPNLWLGLTVDTDAEMSPRLRLGTVPFAASAAFSDDTAHLGGVDLAGVYQKTEMIPWSSLSDVPAAFSADPGSIVRLACSGPQQLAVWNGTAWECQPVPVTPAAGTVGGGCSFNGNTVATWGIMTSCNAGTALPTCPSGYTFRTESLSPSGCTVGGAFANRCQYALGICVKT